MSMEPTDQDEADTEAERPTFEGESVFNGCKGLLLSEK